MLAQTLVAGLLLRRITQLHNRCANDALPLTLSQLDHPSHLRKRCAPDGAAALVRRIARPVGKGWHFLAERVPPAAGISVRLDETCDRRKGHRANNDNERGPGGNLRHPLNAVPAVNERQLIGVDGVQNKLGTDEGEDERNAVLEVFKAFKQTPEQKIQLSKSHKRKNVRRKNNEWTLSDTKNRGNRVECKEKICGSDGHSYDEHRRKKAGAAHRGAQPDAIVRVGETHTAAEHPDNETLLLATLTGVFADLLNSRPDQPGTENIENPTEVLNKRRSEQNKNAAQYKSDDNTHHEHFLLHLSGHREPRHDNNEHKKVVD